MGISVASADGGNIEVSEAAFGRDFNEALVHQVVTAFLAGARAGTAKQKTRSEARGGGRKPWRQKGTNRARVGTIRSPLWRGGGRTFAARPRSYAQKVNRKMYQGALRCIFSELIRQDRLLTTASLTSGPLSLEDHKTKHLATKLAELELHNVIIIADEIDDNLYLASRNLGNVEVRDLDAVDPVCLISHDKVLMTVDALKKMEERLS